MTEAEVIAGMKREEIQRRSENPGSISATASKQLPAGSTIDVKTENG